jgi:cytochrome c
MRLSIVAASLAAGVLAGLPVHAAAPVSVAVISGGHLAQRCAACHAVGLADRSRNSGAPPFRVLARRNPLGLEQTLKRLSRFGHYDMRPTQLSEADAMAIAEYIESLQAPAR